MKKSRPVKMFVYAIIILVTMACGCNLTALQDKVVEIFADQLLGDLGKGETGPVNSELAGLAFNTPDGMEAVLTASDAMISAKDHLFGDPFILVSHLDLAEGKDSAYWLNNQRDDLIYSKDAKITWEENIQISGFNAVRMDFFLLDTNIEEPQETREMTGVRIVVDRSPKQVTLIDGWWPVDQDTDFRPKFEDWLASLQIFEATLPD